MSNEDKKNDRNVKCQLHIILWIVKKELAKACWEMLHKVILFFTQSMEVMQESRIINGNVHVRG